MHFAVRLQAASLRCPITIMKSSPFASLPFEEARAMARAMGLSSLEEWNEYSCPGPYRLPKNPDVIWADEFESWEDWLGVPLEWEEACRTVRAHGLTSEQAYSEFAASGDWRLPAQPQRYYREFTTWATFLGSPLPPSLPPPPLPMSPPPLASPPPLSARRPLPKMSSMAAKWPPAGADPAAIWEEGVSSGPLGRTADALFEGAFRAALARELGRDPACGPAGFAGIIELARALVELRGPASTAAARRVLNQLFPDWPPFAPAGRRGLLYWFEVLFAGPVPAFAAKLNAWATAAMGQWLMGPCDLGDLEAEVAALSEVGDGRQQQVLVRRCRFLEEAACASICVNACKMPTEAFFNEDMGVPMRMVPDYETLECRFQFGVKPTREDELAARSVPCFTACPAGGELRNTLLRCHTMDGLAQQERGGLPVDEAAAGEAGDGSSRPQQQL